MRAILESHNIYKETWDGKRIDEESLYRLLKLFMVMVKISY